MAVLLPLSVPGGEYKTPQIKTEMQKFSLQISMSDEDVILPAIDSLYE